jgi:hypothetical protein
MNSQAPGSRLKRKRHNHSYCTTSVKRLRPSSVEKVYISPEIVKIIAGFICDISPFNNLISSFNNVSSLWNLIFVNKEWFHSLYPFVVVHNVYSDDYLRRCKHNLVNLFGDTPINYQPKLMLDMYSDYESTTLIQNEQSIKSIINKHSYHTNGSPDTHKPKTDIRIMYNNTPDNNYFNRFIMLGLECNILKFRCQYWITRRNDIFIGSHIKRLVFEVENIPTFNPHYPLIMYSALRCLKKDNNTTQIFVTRKTIQDNQQYHGPIAMFYGSTMNEAFKWFYDFESSIKYEYWKNKYLPKPGQKKYICFTTKTPGENVNLRVAKNHHGIWTEFFVRKMRMTLNQTKYRILGYSYEETIQKLNLKSFVQCFPSVQITDWTTCYLEIECI